MTRFADRGQDVKGNNDMLILSRPEIVTAMHDAYLDAGADVIETNTFSATTIAQADYAMEDLAFELNVEGARLARASADKASEDGRPRFVAGAIGPTNRTASISHQTSMIRRAAMLILIRLQKLMQKRRKA